MSTPADNLPPVPVTPDLFIPQVPFKQLPFPWNDLTNTPQPDATQYYPDHAPSVVATLAGMHPTDQQGQTVKTDGNHAILVNNVGASSGASATVIPSSTQYEVAQIDDSGVSELDLYLTNVTLYEFSAAYVLQSDTISDVGQFSWGIEGQTSGKRFYLATVSSPRAGTLNGQQPLVYQFNNAWYQGLDLTQYFSVGELLQFKTFSSDANGYFSLSMMYSGDVFT